MQVHQISKPLLYCLLLSVILHLLGIFSIIGRWQENLETEAFKARLSRATPMFKPRRLHPARQEFKIPDIVYEYKPSHRSAEKLLFQDVDLTVDPPQIDDQIPSLKLRKLVLAAKETRPLLERIAMLSPSELGLANSNEKPSMDLLRMVDMSRANKEHAAVMLDLSSKRDLMGYVNFTQLKLYGAGTGPLLEPLSRYMRDNTLVLANVSDAYIYNHFLSEELLKDPIHFLFEGRGSTAYDDNVVIKFSQEEQALLERYFREGGLIFIEGSNRFLREMRNLLRSILGNRGSLFPLSVSHPLYHSFYEFPGGFPGEDKESITTAEWGMDWYYPAQFQTTDVNQSQRTYYNPNSQLEQRMPPKLGIWGVAIDGNLVAILSDMGFGEMWQSSFAVDETEVAVPTTLALKAGTNIVAYALTRKEGKAVKLSRPAWMTERPTINLLKEESNLSDNMINDPLDDELFSILDASLAVVQAPIGSKIENPLELLIDGRYRLEMMETGHNGLLLHNLPSGPHWIEIYYGGEMQQIDFNLTGGMVLTLNFALNQVAFLSQLRIEQRQEQIGISEWKRSFADLEIEELFIAEDRNWLESNQYREID